MDEKTISSSAVVGSAAGAIFSKREKGEQARFNLSKGIAIAVLFIALMLGGAPQMRGQTQDTVPPKWIHSVEGAIHDIIFHPNGNILATVFTDTGIGVIWELDPNTGEILRIMEQPEIDKDKTLHNIEITPDGSKILVESLERGGYNIYDYTTGKYEKTTDSMSSYFIYDYGQGWVKQMSRSMFLGGVFPDSKRILALTDSGFVDNIPKQVKRIVIYDIEQDTILARYTPSYRRFLEPDRNLARMLLSPDGKYIAMVYVNPNSAPNVLLWYASLWSTDSMREIQDVRFDINGDINEPTEIKWSKDSKYVGFLSAHDYKVDNSVKVFDVAEWISSQGQSGKYVFEDCSHFNFTADSKNVIISPRYDVQYSKLIDITKNIIRTTFGRIGDIYDVYDKTFVTYMGGKIYCYDYSDIGVKEPIKPITPIKSIQYERSNITITLNTQQPVNKITITDITGKTLFQSPQIPNSYGVIEIPLTLPIGTYFVSVEIGDSTYNQKFIVERYKE